MAIKKTFKRINSLTLLIVTFVVFGLFLSCCSSRDEEFMAYQDILPELINKEFLLRPFMPIPPTIEIEGNSVSSIYRNKELDDSVRLVYEVAWEEELRSKKKLLLIKDTLISMNKNNFFIDFENFISEHNDFALAFYESVSCKNSEKAINIQDMRSPEDYIFTSSKDSLTSDFFDLGFLELSRICFDEGKKYGCLGIHFTLANGIQSFEAVLLIQKKKGRWSIVRYSGE